MPVYFADERLSSMVALQVLRDQYPERKGRRQGVDAVAAQLILETFFSHGENGDAAPETE